MARIPRLYRVVATFPDGTTKTRRYLTPEAAEERRQWFLNGSIHDEPETVYAVACTVTPSHPVTYPLPAGDADPLAMPDSLIQRSKWLELVAHLGLAAEPIKTITVHGTEIAVEYQPDPKRAPLSWRVEIIEESKS